jgi:predicted phosphodiesterase
MRVAVLSDIHANRLGLDAVLDDITQLGGVDSYIVLGDVVAQGYDPAGTADRLRRLDAAVFVMGNTDEWVINLDWRSALVAAVGAEEAPRSAGSLGPLLAAGLAWTNGSLAATGQLDWLSEFLAEWRTVLPDGTRVLAVHTAPRRGGSELTPNLSDEELAAAVDGCGADLVCAGDSHLAMDRAVTGVRIINPGCIGNPLERQVHLVASYGVITASEAGYEFRLREVPYDREAVMAAIRSSRFAPNPEWLVSKYSP